MFEPSANRKKPRVSHATRVFSECTRNAMQYYIEKEDGFTHWEGTLNFLHVIAKWWDILNVKNPNKGKRKSHPDSERITKHNLDEITKHYQTLSNELRNGNHLETFRQTSSTMPLFAKYLLEELALEYVLIGKIQSDFLE